MPWSATSRYALAPAPGALGLAQDLLNTAPAGHEPDLLADLASARTWVSEATARWSAATGLPPRGHAERCSRRGRLWSRKLPAAAAASTASAPE